MSTNWTDKMTFMGDGQVLNKSLLPESVRQELGKMEFYLLADDEVLAVDDKVQLALCHPSDHGHMLICTECREFWDKHPVLKGYMKNGPEGSDSNH